MIKKFFIHIPKNGGMTLRYIQLIRPKIELAQQLLEILGQGLFQDICLQRK